MDNLSRYFKFLAGLADIFEARFMKPLWNRHPGYNSDSFDALALFLDGYAFARQGARPDYGHVAVDVVNELRNQRQTLTDESISQKAWDMFRNHLGDQGLNPSNSPLCPSGTYYNKRSTGSSLTHGSSVLEFLRSIAESNLPPNIISFAKYSIQIDEVAGGHSKLCEINGVASKIASLFLRDVARHYAIFPSKDRNLLQPVDIWIQRISEYLLQSKLSKKEVAAWILAQAIKNNVNPEAVNEGMWYFGSEIVDSNYRMSRALNDLGYAKALLDEHIEAVHQEVLVWEHTQCR